MTLLSFILAGGSGLTGIHVATASEALTERGFMDLTLSRNRAACIEIT
jgi:hypothetical protein